MIRDRAARGPSQDRPGPSPERSRRRRRGRCRRDRRCRLPRAARWVAAISEEGAADLPTLLVTFESNGFIVDQPDEQVQRVDTTIVYGDAREENFTSTISETAHVDWVGVDDLTRFVPGPTGRESVSRFEADGENARVLIGKPSEWPELERFTQIERLPAEPGDYVLLFEATYPDGIAQYAQARPASSRRASCSSTSPKARRSTPLPPLRTSTGAVPMASSPLAGSWREIRRADGAPSSQLRARFVDRASPRIASVARDEMQTKHGPVSSRGTRTSISALPLPIDLLGGSGVVEGPDGRHLLAVDVSWKEGRRPDTATMERKSARSSSSGSRIRRATRAAADS